MGVHGPEGLAKAAARMAIMFVRPAIPVDVGIVQGRPYPQPALADWLVVLALLLGAGLAAYRLIRPDPGPTKIPSLWAPLAGFVATDITVCFMTMPPFPVEGSRLLYLPSAFSAIFIAFLLAPVLSRPLVKAGAIAFVLCGVWFTYFNGTLYRDAGAVCQDTVEWFQTHAPGPGPALILLPDSIGGRYVWRNGFDGATATFLPKWAATPRAVVPYVDGLQVLQIRNAGAFDFRGIAKGNVVRTDIPDSAHRLEHANVVIVWPSGSVDNVQGADVTF